MKVSRRNLFKFIPALGLGAVLGKEIVAKPPRALPIERYEPILLPYMQALHYLNATAATVTTTNDLTNYTVWYADSATHQVVDVPWRPA